MDNLDHVNHVDRADHVDQVDHFDHVDHNIIQIAEAVTDLTAHDLLKQKFPSRPSERMHMVSI